MNRRSMLKGLVATAAGILVAPDIATEPDRRVWAFPRNPLVRRLSSDGDSIVPIALYDVIRVDGELLWVTDIREEPIFVFNGVPLRSVVWQTATIPAGAYTSEYLPDRIVLRQMEPER